MVDKTTDIRTKRSEAARKAAATRKLNADRKAAEKREAEAARKGAQTRARNEEVRRQKAAADRKATAERQAAEAKAAEAEHRAAENRYVETEPKSNWTWIPWVIAGLLVFLLIVAVIFLPRAPAATPAVVVQPTAAPVIIYVQQPTAAPVVPAVVVQPTAVPVVVLPTTAPVVPAVVVQPTAVPTAAPAEGQADIRAKVESFDVNGWHVTTYQGVTDQITTWAHNLKAPDKMWSETPNSDSPSHNFLAKNGMFWDDGESHYCQQAQTCDVNNPPRSIRVVTGDYNLGFISGKRADTNDGGYGFILVNVSGDESTMLRDINIDYGWTVVGPYWNGDEMVQTLWAVSSNVLYNTLGEGDGTNNGGNCTKVTGCPDETLTIVVMSGNQVLWIGTTTVTK